MARILFILFFLSAGHITYAQSLATKAGAVQAEFDSQIKKADSLKDAGKFKEAFRLYDNQISRYLSGEIGVRINPQNWKFLLSRAGDAASRSDQLTAAMRYWNLVKGSYGEKINDKIEFLKDMGVKWYYTYRAFETGGSNVIIVGECTAGDTQYLMWMHNGKCYIQAFNECDTFKPVGYVDNELYKLYTGNADTIAKEEIFHLKAGSAHCLNFSFNFPANGEISQSFDINDITDYKTDTLPYIRLQERRLVDKYHHNMLTMLKRLNMLSYAVVKRYTEFIHSAPERAKIGRL